MDETADDSSSLRGESSRGAGLVCCMALDVCNADPPLIVLHEG